MCRSTAARRVSTEPYLHGAQHTSNQGRRRSSSSLQQCPGPGRSDLLTSLALSMVSNTPSFLNFFLGKVVMG